MWIWIVLAVVTTAAGVYAFWPRADRLDSRVNRASIIAHGRADSNGPSGPSDVSGGAGGAL